MPVKPLNRLQVSGSRLKELQDRIKKHQLAETDWELLQGLTETIEHLGQALAKKDTSLGRLCKYLLGAPTETAKNVLKDRRPPLIETVEKPEPKGHGRKPASVYVGLRAGRGGGAA